MTHIAFVHSYRGGTGKSIMVANLAATLADQGKRVGVIDTNLQAPSLHYLFDQTGLTPTLNDYLRGRCPIQAAIHEISNPKAPKDADANGASTPNGVMQTRGPLWLLPASDRMNEIVYLWENEVNRALLARGIQAMARYFALDFLFVDTDPGMDKQTFFALEAADSLLMVMTPDEQDARGGAATLQVVRRLEIPHIFILVNKIPSTADPAAVQLAIEALCEAPITGRFLHAEEMLKHGSKGIFVHHYPEHPITVELKKVADALLAVR